MQLSLTIRLSLFFLTFLTAASASAQYLGGFGDGAVVSGAVSAVAPLDLLSFQARAATATVELDWTTANEDGTDLFQVERSADGLVYKTIGTVEAAGFSDEGVRLVYTFSDADPISGKAYYRLLVLDLDGTFQYSNVVTAVHRPSDAEFAIFPNPSDGRVVRLELPMVSDGRAVQVEVLDATGRQQVANEWIYPEENQAYLRFAEGLPAGSYLVRLHTARTSLPGKLLIVSN